MLANKQRTVHSVPKGAASSMVKTSSVPHQVQGKRLEATETINFKVAAAFKREFKGYAVSQGLTMLELLKEGFELSKATRKPK